MIQKLSVDKTAVLKNKTTFIHRIIFAYVDIFRKLFKILKNYLILKNVLHKNFIIKEDLNLICTNKILRN